MFPHNLRGQRGLNDDRPVRLEGLQERDNVVLVLGTDRVAERGHGAAAIRDDGSGASAGYFQSFTVWPRTRKLCTIRPWVARALFASVRLAAVP